jgi:spore germination protein GerM
MLLLVGCGSSAGPSTNSTATVAPRSVSVYFLDRDGRLGGERRRLSGADAPLLAALRALAQGPSRAGLAPAFPAGTRVLDATAEGDHATVDLSAEFEVGFPRGSSGELGVLVPLVWTATAIPGITHVQLLVEGRLPEVAGTNLDLSQSLTRRDLPQGAP